VNLRLAQDPNSEHLGTTVWDASIVLAKFFEKVGTEVVSGVLGLCPSRRSIRLLRQAVSMSQLPAAVVLPQQVVELRQPWHCAAPQ
jgi:hypothetical protein